MELPHPLRFTPVPLRRTHNGWSSTQQRDFVIALARGASVKQAATGLGRSRQSAYMLRGKPGAQSFAAAWAKALAFARDVRTTGTRLTGLPELLDILLVPRFHGGRLVGFVQREDDRRLFADLRRLEAMIERCTPGPRQPSGDCHN